jgi:hypothetical protein
MKKKGIVFLGIVLISLMLQNSKVDSKGSSEQIQQLYSKINNDLLAIRKEHPDSQKTVYSVLDQVCKMYSVSKSVIERKKALKHSAANEKNALRVKNLAMAQKVKNLEDELGSTKENANSSSKTAQQKDSVISQLTKEKAQLLNEKNRLEEEKKQLLLKMQNPTAPQQVNNTEANKNLSENRESIFINHSQLKPRKLSLHELQNLSLNSTSEPISPL